MVSLVLIIFLAFFFFYIISLFHTGDYYQAIFHTVRLIFISVIVVFAIEMVYSLIYGEWPPDDSVTAIFGIVILLIVGYSIVKPTLKPSLPKQFREAQKEAQWQKQHQEYLNSLPPKIMYVVGYYDEGFTEFDSEKEAIEYAAKESEYNHIKVYKVDGKNYCVDDDFNHNYGIYQVWDFPARKERMK